MNTQTFSKETMVDFRIFKKIYIALVVYATQTLDVGIRRNIFSLSDTPTVRQVKTEFIEILKR